MHIKACSFPDVLEIEENDAEVLREPEKVQKQVGKLSHDIKILTASETKCTNFFCASESDGMWVVAREPACPDQRTEGS